MTIGFFILLRHVFSGLGWVFAASGGDGAVTGPRMMHSRFKFSFFLADSFSFVHDPAFLIRHQPEKGLSAARMLATKILSS